MFFSFLLFLLLFLFIFFLSPQISTVIYQLAFLLTRNKKISLGILIIFLLPGTIIHELSHFFVATLLFVPSGNISIFPRIEEGIIKAGSLHHANTDPLRRSLIGLAPMIVGIALIYIIGQLLLSQLTTYNLQLTTILFFYLLFTISTSMFSSKKDLEVAWFFLPLILLILAVLYWKGLRISITSDLTVQINSFFSKLTIYLFITFILDLGTFSIFKCILLLLQKIFRLKLVPKT